MRNAGVEPIVEWPFASRTLLVLGKWPVKVYESQYGGHDSVSPVTH